MLQAVPCKKRPLLQRESCSQRSFWNAGLGMPTRPAFGGRCIGNGTGCFLMFFKFHFHSKRSVSG